MKKRITVFCGSSEGANPVYMQTARELGAALAAQGCELIYGAGSRGLMGETARAALEGGAHVTGVNITRFANSPYQLDVCENLMVETIQERKMLMIEKCDAAICLPGGVGTLDEMFEMLSMLQLGLIDRPVGILNVDGYYDPLMAFAAKMTDEGFFKEKYAKIWIVRDNVKDLLAALDEVQDAGRF